MPRIPRTSIRLSIRTVLDGPVTSPAREREVNRVKTIKIRPEIESLLETPTWSVTSLLPPPSSKPEDSDGSVLLAWQSSAPTFEAEEEITPHKLHHLLKLSALPPPRSQKEENEMLSDLRDQVHFVKEIQKVDTTHVKPLVAIRDETSEHRHEKTISKAALDEFIALEEKKGKNGTIRRRKDTYQVTSVSFDNQPWKEDPLAWTKVKDPWAFGEGSETRKMGKFFFVKRKQAAQAGPESDGKTESSDVGWTPLNEERPKKSRFENS